MGGPTNNRTVAATLIATPIQSIIPSLALVPAVILLLGRTMKSMIDKTTSHGTSYQRLQLSLAVYITSDVVIIGGNTNVHLQEALVAMVPPSKGPSPLPKATARPMKPLYLPRCCSVVTSLAMIWTRAVLFLLR